LKICVVGTGYVGLVSGTCFADLGNTVCCIDNNSEKIKTLNRGESPFYEPGLAERITRNATANRLTFSSNLKEAVSTASIIFIAVGTPPLDSGKADLSAVFSVATEVLNFIKQNNSGEFKVIVTKSTVPVGTGQKIMSMRDDTGLTEQQVGILSNPEFLREGTAIYDFFHPDRIVLGSANSKALDMVATLYEPLYRRDTPIIKTTIQTSELSKYASNAFLATKISFINEMANICEKTNASVKDISNIMGMDGRIGKYFLHPGPGYGGSCFPKDTQALVHLADEVGYDLKIVKAVEEVNKLQKDRSLFYLLDYYNNDLSNKTIGILGLAFKPNTDDMRESSSLAIIDKLLACGAKVKAFDPEVKSLAQYSSNDSFSMLNSSYEVAENTDALFLVTEWNTFRELDLEKIKNLMATPVFFDLRNVYSARRLQDAGFTTYIIGEHLITDSLKVPISS